MAPAGLARAARAHAGYASVVAATSSSAAAVARPRAQASTNVVVDRGVGAGGEGDGKAVALAAILPSAPALSTSPVSVAAPPRASTSPLGSRERSPASARGPPRHA
ncbi:MAG: hypothetical protein JST00_27495 [Deltaproteobacteria bacterium]|nr:hypothetical protein [Deltaproteobacteria bacterium]